MDGRTDTMCENNDHHFGRGLVGQLLTYTSIELSIFKLKSSEFSKQLGSLLNFITFCFLDGSTNRRTDGSSMRETN